MTGKQTILHEDQPSELSELGRELLQPLEQMTGALSKTPENEEYTQIKVSELRKLQLHSSILAQIIKLTKPTERK